MSPSFPPLPPSISGSLPTEADGPPSSTLRQPLKANPRLLCTLRYRLVPSSSTAMNRREILTWVCCATVAAALVLASPAAALGVNWGTIMSHPFLPTTVVQMIKANGITKVKLFDADSWTVSAFAGTGIELMLAIPNDMLKRISSDYSHAQDWVKENVTKHDYDGGVNIKYLHPSSQH